MPAPRWNRAQVRCRPAGARPVLARLARHLWAGFLLVVAGCTAAGSGTGGSLAPSAPSAPSDAAPAPRTIQPSAPGEPTRLLSAADVAAAEHPPHTRADVLFMQGMLHHHAQAIVMTGLAATHTTSQDIRLLARRIELSQDDEIALMVRWLEERGEEAPTLVLRFDDMDHAGMDHAGTGHEAPAPGHGDHGGHGGHGGEDGLPMHGMLTDAELMELAAARDRAFDRLFLQFMIRHHEGAVRMVNDLFASPGGGQEEEIFQFASHVEGDQNIEIRRMLGMLNARR